MPAYVLQPQDNPEARFYETEEDFVPEMTSSQSLVEDCSQSGGLCLIAMLDTHDGAHNLHLQALIALKKRRRCLSQFKSSVATYIRLLLPCSVFAVAQALCAFGFCVRFLYMCPIYCA